MPTGAVYRPAPLPSVAAYGTSVGRLGVPPLRPQHPTATVLRARVTGLDVCAANATHCAAERSVRRKSKWTVSQLRRQLAYDRILERLYMTDDDWIVKGTRRRGGRFDYLECSSNPGIALGRSLRASSTASFGVLNEISAR